MNLSTWQMLSLLVCAFVGGGMGAALITFVFLRRMRRKIMANVAYGPWAQSPADEKPGVTFGARGSTFTRRG